MSEKIDFRKYLNSPLWDEGKKQMAEFKRKYKKIRRLTNLKRRMRSRRKRKKYYQQNTK